MAVPKYYEFYNAFLEALSDGSIVEFSDCKEYIKRRMKMTPEQLSELSESGGPVWANRVGWCATYLKNAGLVVTPKRAAYQITGEGRSLLSEGITITDKILAERCPAFLEFKQQQSMGKKNAATRTLKKPDEQVWIAEAAADESLIEQLQDSEFSAGSVEPQFSGGPKAKAEPVLLQGRRAYPRSRDTAINALSRAHFSCEIDSGHPTFLRRQSEYQYTEPHHLIPMSYQDQFDVSLDVEENIVSLCCTCHKQIHYGAEAKSLVERLYEERKDRLRIAGIAITREMILDMYK